MQQVLQIKQQIGSFVCVWLGLGIKMIYFLDKQWCQLETGYEHQFPMLKPGGNLWFRKLKPMQKCLKPAFLQLTSRGRLHWLQKEV